MIFVDSRYADGTIAQVLGKDGAYHAAVFPATHVESDTVIVVTVERGVTMASLAAIAYGDSELWWHIAGANPQIFYPDDIKVGSLIRVPDIGVLQ